MHWRIGIKKIEKLETPLLRQCVESLKTDIVVHKKCIENYTPDNMKKHGIPFTQMLEQHMTTFELELERRKCSKN